jgi:hypothetical protein
VVQPGAYSSDFMTAFLTFFTQQNPDQDLYSSKEIRKELYRCHFDDNLFNLGDQADATECF